MVNMKRKITIKGDIIITDPCYVINSGNDAPSIKDYISDPNISSKLFELYTAEERVAYQRYESDCKQYKATHPDQWNMCDSGSDMSKLGFTTYISDTTIYGDWSCTTFKLYEPVNQISELREYDIEETLGYFCADSGMVGVFLLSEVLANNPEFDYHINRPWTTTLIKEFEGIVEYVVEDDEVYIVGTGNINFITRQTGL